MSPVTSRLARHENQLLKSSGFIFRVKLILNRLVPSCREVTYLISRSMESRLALYERILLCLHTFVCSDCTRYQQQLILIRRLLGVSPSALNVRIGFSTDISPMTTLERIEPRLKV